MASTEALGTFPDRHTLRLAIRYPHPPSRVWRALTDPEELAAWFMPIDIEPRVGGLVLLKNYGQEGAAPPAEGVVTVFEPEVALEYRFDKGDWEWPEGTLRYDLTAEENGCRLVFTHRLAPDHVPTWRGFDTLQIAGPGTHLPGGCAGWQGFFQEGLSRFLDGRRPPIYDDADDRIMELRGERYRAAIEARFVGS